MRAIRTDLAELPLFSECSRSELAQISRLLTKLRLPAGRVLTEEGALGDEFMIIVDGMAEVSRAGSPVALLGRGDVVGEMALLDDSRRGRRNATVTAVTELTVYVGTPAEFRYLLEVAPSVAEAIRQTASERTPVAA